MIKNCTKYCDRCGKETRTSKMSYFNTDECCMDCISLESKHPDYEYAKRIENEEVRKGNYNYKGVGLPENYHEWAKMQNINKK